jgi:hypothetical protein
VKDPGADMAPVRKLCCAVVVVRDLDEFWKGLEELSNSE